MGRPSRQVLEVAKGSCSLALLWVTPRSSRRRPLRSHLLQLLHPWFPRAHLCWAATTGRHWAAAGSIQAPPGALPLRACLLEVGLLLWCPRRHRRRLHRLALRSSMPALRRSMPPAVALLRRSIPALRSSEAALRRTQPALRSSKPALSPLCRSSFSSLSSPSSLSSLSSLTTDIAHPSSLRKTPPTRPRACRAPSWPRATTKKRQRRRVPYRCHRAPMGRNSRRR
mmetsp:Transcript_56426/g.123946  ORF Transcript_56426/g.123946 Transcript_56426/m.123946 type:complete len:226 (+) Transcript_56426:556-1233(+)